MIIDGFDIGFAHALWVAGYLAAFLLVALLVGLVALAGSFTGEALGRRVIPRLDILRNRRST